MKFAEIDLPLKKRDLYLAVSGEGDISHDWADWLEPKITLKDGKLVDLTGIKWESATTGHARVQIGKNCEGKPLSAGGKVYQKGIGVHARSMIHYRLPEGAKRFQVKVALDDGGAIRDGGRTPASVRFFVFDKKPAKIPEGQAEAFDPDSLEAEKVPVTAFEVPDDLEVTVWATSPMLYNPTNMDTDAKGRIWVAEGVNYRRHQKRRPEGDRIVVLQDTNGDGKADSSHTFVQDPELVAPLGVSVLDNQIVVAQPPHLIVYTDVDRNLRFDPKVDKRENLLSGFNGKNHDHSLHAVVAGPDGKWYFNQGNCGAMFTSKDGKTFKIGGPYRGGGGEWFVDNIKFGGEKSDDGHVWVGGFAGKMDPDGKNVQIIGHGFRNSYEHTVTSMGDVFQNDNDDPPACRTTWLMEGGFLGFFSPDGKRTWQADRRPGQSVPRAHWRQDDPGTLPPGDVYGGGSPTGICYYEHGALPKKYEGLLLSCEAAKRVVYGYHPKPEGANFKLERFDFFKSKTGNMFRPSDVMVGADGAIYVADWYDPGVGGHADRDGSCSGTIYRIAPKGFKPKFSQEGQSNPITEAVKMLKSPAINVRYAGFKILRDTGPKALPALMEVMRDSNKYVRARAIHLLPYMGKEGRMVLNGLLGNKSAGMRLMAMRSLRSAGEDSVRLARALVVDASPQVRREVAVALRDVDPQAKIPLVVELLHRYDGDRTYLEACGFAAEGVEEKVWNGLRLVKKGAGALDWTPDLARIAWRLKIPSLIPALQERAASSTLSDADRLFSVDSLAFIDDPRSVPAMVSLAKVPGPVGASASRWLIHLSNTRWSQFGVKDVLKKEGIYDPGKVEIVSVLVPKATKSSLPPLKDLMKLKGNVARGKTTAARCIMCHQLEGQGVNFGPDLKGWIERQGKEMFLRSVVNPSEQIAQGYTGSSIKLKEGGEVQGLVLSKSNPVIVQSQGGLVQMIPADKVEKVSNMKHSLMLSADQLGLSAQDLADLTSYLETLK